MRARTGKEIGLIYFMRRADGVGPIKIGCSKWPQERLRALQIWSPEPLEIVATVPGSFRDERRLHCQFAEHRLHGEWFEAAAPVLAAVARAASHGELPPTPANDRSAIIMARFERGETLAEIGKDFGVSRERIRQIVKKEGGTARGYGKPRRAPVWDALGTVRRLAASGSSVTEIAEAVQDSRNNVYMACRAEGIKVKRGVRARLPATAKRAFDIAADYKAGIKTAEIALKHGVKQPYVFAYLRIAGVKPSRVKRRHVDRSKAA